MPFSKETQFGAEDVRELASLVAERAGEIDVRTLRLPKLRAMFASRACRSAVMVGTALNDLQMARLTRNLTTIDHPWNCPHGRPTMRHLADLADLRARHTRAAAAERNDDLDASATFLGADDGDADAAL